MIEEELSIKALGCIPNEKELTIGSRHLGLILPEEMEELNFQLEKAGQLLEKYVDVDAMIGIAESAFWEKEETVTEEVKPEEKERFRRKSVFWESYNFFSGNFQWKK